MKPHPRLLTLILLFSLLLIPAQPARADVAPPPPPEGAAIQPGQETTQVRMVSEQVLVDVRQNAYDQPTRANVTATFQMRNLGDTEERMQARFPLNVLFPQYQSDFNTCVFPIAAPEINDFRAWVDGKQVAVTNTLQRIKDELRSQQERDVKCWANFPAVFPPGKDVTIEVRYSVEGYRGQDVDGVIEFPYVLVTGEAWKNTIGRAEITFRAPFELTTQTLFNYYPDERAGAQVTVAGRELRWVYEDFEPQQNVQVNIMNPGLWQRIQREQDALKKNPQDGEAWGRLGRWYKEAIKLRRGFRWDAGGTEMYRLSKEAYAKAVTLLPKDADWHAGYADLLCWNTLFDQLGSKIEARDDLVGCYNEIRVALAINPRQSLALNLLDDMRYYQPYPPGDPLMKEEGGKVDYLVLTTTPTARPTDIVIPEITEASPTAAEPTASPTPSVTETAILRRPTATPLIVSVYDFTQTAVAVNTAAAKPTDFIATQTNPEKGKGSGSGPCGAAVLPIAAALAAVVIRRRTGM